MYTMYCDVYNAVSGVIGATKKVIVYLLINIVSILFDFVCSFVMTSIIEYHCLSVHLFLINSILLPLRETIV